MQVTHIKSKFYRKINNLTIAIRERPFRVVNPSSREKTKTIKNKVKEEKELTPNGQSRMHCVVVLHFAIARKSNNITMSNTSDMNEKETSENYISIVQCSLNYSREAQRQKPSTRGPPIPFVNNCRMKYFRKNKKVQKLLEVFE